MESSKARHYQSVILFGKVGKCLRLLAVDIEIYQFTWLTKTMKKKADKFLNWDLRVITVYNSLR